MGNNGWYLTEYVAGGVRGVLALALTVFFLWLYWESG
jgi:hypothetical protein